MKEILKEESPNDFAAYRDGYNDGYFGEPLKFPENNFYLMGYEEGKEADSTGNPNKFS